MKLIALAGLLLAVCAHPLHAAPDTDAEIKQKIERKISLRHPDDTAEWWRALGPRAPKVMIPMVAETDNTYHRLRLIEALGWFQDDAEAAAFLKDQAKKEGQEDVLKYAAIRSVGRAQGVKELEFVAGFLEDPDADARVAAADTLKRMKDPAAEQRLSKYLAEEKTPWVVAKVKGEPPPISKTPIRSNAQRVAEMNDSVAALAGTWKGVWVKPKAGKGSGMATGKGEAILTAEGKGEARAGGKPLFKLSEIEGKRAAMTGKALSVSPGAQAVAWKGEAYATSAGDWILEIRLRDSGLVFIGRR